MKVTLIKESSGFGFDSKIPDWIFSDQTTNLDIIEKIRNYETVELKSDIAVHFHNLINTETGEIVSKSYLLSPGWNPSKYQKKILTKPELKPENEIKNKE